MHVGYSDPREQPLANGARARHVIFKNTLAWNKVDAVLKKFGPGRALWRG